MEIKKILSLTESEMNTLVEAGKLLGAIRDDVDNFDALDTDVFELLAALKAVLSEI